MLHTHEYFRRTGVHVYGDTLPSCEYSNVQNCKPEAKGFSGPQLWHKLSRFFTLSGLSAIKDCSYFTSNNTSSAFLVTQIFAKRSSSSLSYHCHGLLRVKAEKCRQKLFNLQNNNAA